MWNLKLYQQTFQILLHLNPLVQLALWMDLLILYDSVTSSIGHLENTGSMSYADHFIVDTFHCTIWKNHIHWHYHWSHQKRPMGRGQTQHGAYDFFPNSNFAWNSTFIIHNKSCPLFSLNWHSLHSFMRKCLPNTQFWKAMVCLPVVLPSKNGPWKTKPVQLTANNHTVFFLHNHHAWFVAGVL